MTYVPPTPHIDVDLLVSIQHTLNDAVAISNGRLFLVREFQERYTRELKPGDEPIHQCAECSDFLHASGLLYKCNGEWKAALWDETKLPQGHRHHNAVKAMRIAVESGRMTGVAFWDKAFVGEPGHLHAHFHRRIVPFTKTAWDLTCEKGTDRDNLDKALEVLTPAMLEKAIRLLNDDTLHSTAKIRPQAIFLQRVMCAVSRLRGEARNRELWLQIGGAASGWCAYRGSMLQGIILSQNEGCSMKALVARHNDRR